MIKVMWFLKRAEHLTRQEFADWWLHRHALDVARHQSPHLKRYVVNLSAEPGQLAAGATQDLDWDGIAEQWFEDEDAYQRAYGTQPSPTRADTLANTSRFARMVVREHEIAPGAAAPLSAAPG